MVTCHCAWALGMGRYKEVRATIKETGLATVQAPSASSSLYGVVAGRFRGATRTGETTAGYFRMFISEKKRLLFQELFGSSFYYSDTIQLRIRS